MKYMIVVREIETFVFEGEGDMDAIQKRVDSLKSGIIAEGDHEVSSHRSRLEVEPRVAYTYANESRQDDWIVISCD